MCIRDRLGVNADPAATNWYNRGPATGCPVDASIFPDRYGWTVTSNNTLATYNITTGAPALVGQPDVTFRFVLSVAPGFSASGYAVDGFMIDDFEILGPANPPIGAAPTAANASIEGRVRSADGQGIRNATVMITGGGLSEPRYVQTGSFGAFRFDELPVGETYIVSVVSRRYVFANPTRVITLDDNVTDFNFEAVPR